VTSDAAAVIAHQAATWWAAGPDSPARALVTSWALRHAGAAQWRQALASAAPGQEAGDD
jgi:hypothetical protein